MRHVERVDGVDHCDALRCDPLVPEGAVHVQRAEDERRAFGVTRSQRLLPSTEERGHKFREAILANRIQQTSPCQALEHGEGSAAQPSAQLKQYSTVRRHPLLDGERADVVVDRVEAVAVGEVVDPEAKPPRREQYFLARHLPPQECRILLGDGLREGVGRHP